MNPSNYLFRVDTSTRRLSPSEGMKNKVTIIFGTSNEEIHEDQVTGIRTPIHSDLEFMGVTVKLSFDSNCSQTRMAYLLFGRMIQYFSSSSEVSATRISTAASLCEALATRIALETSKLGFPFELNLLLALTEQRVVSVGSSPLLQKLVFEGFTGGERMGKETCSICLEDLLFGGLPTRMPCSHVFHARCLLEWFVRKTTCPICLEDLLCGKDESGF